MGGVRFRPRNPRVIEHERIVRAGFIRFNLGQDRVQQIGVMNSGIENLRRAAGACCL